MDPSHNQPRSCTSRRVATCGTVLITNQFSIFIRNFFERNSHPLQTDKDGLRYKLNAELTINARLYLASDAKDVLGRGASLIDHRKSMFGGNSGGTDRVSPRQSGMLD